MAGASNEMGRSIVLAADVEPEQFEPLVTQMQGVPGVSGVKIGSEVGLGLRLDEAAFIANDGGLDAIYDHQKAGNDIPATGKNFARAMERAGVDAAILFPFTGPVSQEQWTRELQERGIRVITGAEMTHPQIEASADGLSEGYVNGAAFRRIFELATKLGVRDFVVPGNKPEKVAGYKEFFDSEIGEGEYKLWAPGFITQRGDLSETGAVAGPNFNAIVGSGIYANKEGKTPHQAAYELGQSILKLS